MPTSRTSKKLTYGRTSVRRRYRSTVPPFATVVAASDPAQHHTCLSSVADSLTGEGVEGPDLQEAPAVLLRISEKAVQSRKRVRARPQDRPVVEHQPAEDVSVVLGKEGFARETRDRRTRRGDTLRVEIFATPTFGQ